MVAEFLSVEYGKWSPLIDGALDVDRELAQEGVIPVETTLFAARGSQIGNTTLEIVRINTQRWSSDRINTNPIYFFDENGSKAVVSPEQLEEDLDKLVSVRWWKDMGGLRVGLMAPNGDQLE